MSSPRQTSNVISLSSPRHAHAGQPVGRPVKGTDPRRLVSLRQFALISRNVARLAGLIDSRGNLVDHDRTAEQLRSMAFATVSDRRGDDDALETRAPGIVADHGFADAVAAQLTHGADMGIGDLTYWVEADDLPDTLTADAPAQSLAA